MYSAVRFAFFTTKRVAADTLRASETASTYVVERIDWSGNRFIMSTKNMTRIEAESMAAKFDALGHHQTYIARLSDTDESPNTFYPATSRK